MKKEVNVLVPSSNSHCLKMKFSIKNFFSKCDQIRKKLRIWSHLLKKSLTENFIFCAVSVVPIVIVVVPFSRHHKGLIEAKIDNDIPLGQLGLDPLILTHSN